MQLDEKKNTTKQHIQPAVFSLQQKQKKKIKIKMVMMVVMVDNRCITAMTSQRPNPGAECFSVAFLALAQEEREDFSSFRGVCGQNGDDRFFFLPSLSHTSRRRYVVNNRRGPRREKESVISFSMRARSVPARSRSLSPEGDCFFCCFFFSWRLNAMCQGYRK